MANRCNNGRVRLGIRRLHIVLVNDLQMTVARNPSINDIVLKR